MDNGQVNDETRQRRWEKRLKKKRERMPKHGRSLARIYIDAIRKQLEHYRVDKRRNKQ